MSMSRACTPPTSQTPEWTAERVAERLEQAAEVERRRPAVLVRPDGMRSSWPTRGMRHGQDYLDLRPDLPTAQEITLAEEAMGWLTWIKSPEVRRMLWSRACGQSTRAMMRQYRRDVKIIERMCRDGLERIATRLTDRGA